MRSCRLYRALFAHLPHRNSLLLDERNMHPLPLFPLHSCWPSLLYVVAPTEPSHQKPMLTGDCWVFSIVQTRFIIYRPSPFLHRNASVITGFSSLCIAYASLRHGLLIDRLSLPHDWTLSIICTYFYLFFLQYLLHTYSLYQDLRLTYQKSIPLGSIESKCESDPESLSIE